jgi:hypothetical protein
MIDLRVPQPQQLLFKRDDRLKKRWIGFGSALQYTLVAFSIAKRYLCPESGSFP